MGKAVPQMGHFSSQSEAFSSQNCSYLIELLAKEFQGEPLNNLECSDSFSLLVTNCNSYPIA